MEKEILSIKEFSEKTGLAEYVVRRMIKEGMQLYTNVEIRYIYIMKKH